MTLTEEQRQAYIANPGKCPLCGNDDIYGGFVNVEYPHAFQDVLCNNSDCEAEWTDVYTLTGINE